MHRGHFVVLSVRMVSIWLATSTIVSKIRVKDGEGRDGKESFGGY